jgi:hypothetical protein
MSIYQFFTDFQDKMYKEHLYTMDKLNPVTYYWYYDKLKGQKVFTELGYHNYHKHYAEQFHDLRHSVKKVLEIGVFRGHSLLMWHDYFPNAEIYGVDISFEWHNMGVNAVELCKDKPRINLLEETYPCQRAKISEDGLEMYEHLCHTNLNGIYKAPTYMNGFSRLFEDISKTDLYEGLVIKKIDSKLSYGFQELNNHDWQIKCRKPTKVYHF